MSMESLISVMNKLHDVFNALGTDAVQLPQIVAIGTQSSGKSSVLENLVGRDFLPRGPGLVTRCPLVIQLIYTTENKTIQCESNTTEMAEEWGKFLHTGDRIYTDFDKIRKEIEAETEKKSGLKKGITFEPINLKIYSPYVVNLTLVDLPGITKIPVGDQPEDIEIQVRQLILQYIKNPNAIILAVTAANTDFVTSESLKFARECDPKGMRTLAVITKVDLMDAGTDATDVLCCRVIPVKLGIIGVVNRSQQDIVDNKSIDDAITDEALFLQRKYPALASKNGTAFLRKTLNKLLIRHITDCLPHLKKRINRMMSHYQSLVHSFGDIITDQSQTLLQFITKFTSLYCCTIEGTARDIETTELSGGARICYIFHETFNRALNKIDPLCELTSGDILTAIRNATGTKPAYFIPELAFELLVKRQIQRLEKPSLRCVGLVYEEMQRIVRHCGAEFQQEIKRFPMLHDGIVDVVSKLLDHRLPVANAMVQNLVLIELAYINTKHPDFCDSPIMHTRANQAEEISNTSEIPITNASFEAGICINPISEANSQQNPELNDLHDVNYELDLNINDAKSNSKSIQETSGDTSEDLGRMQKRNWINCLSKSPSLRMGIEHVREGCSTPSLNLSISPDNESCGQMRKMRVVESRECEIIRYLIRSYFSIVKKSIQDTVPKAIMHCLVNYTKDNLQSELVAHLYKAEKFSSLLQESEHIATGRKTATEMLQALQKANQIINEIRDTSL